jgi:hypothetical protein
MSCSAPDQSDVQVGGVVGPPVPEGATLIEGYVRRDGSPVAGAYVRLLDRGGEFTAEVVAGPAGQFRFHAAPGLWTVRALAPGARGARTIEASLGRTEIDIALSAARD